MRRSPEEELDRMRRAYEDNRQQQSKPKRAANTHAYDYYHIPSDTALSCMTMICVCFGVLVGACWAGLSWTAWFAIVVIPLWLGCLVLIAGAIEDYRRDH